MGQFDPEIIAEHTFSADGSNDEFECGLLLTKPHKNPVAYAKLGKTTVMIYRDTYGALQVELDDVADEDVYVTANLQSLVTTGEEFSNADAPPWTGRRLEDV